ncbi:MAG: NAD-dependent epimerase/dehydratase family protein [Mariniphaga sp.]|nr:NAD-dependent epimerase/dehydratase family protein [Mariniphaga sp.]
MIFVTGGTGLVGAHLLLELVKAGNSVIALKRKSSNLSRTLKIFSFYQQDYQELFNKIKWIDGDILDYYSLENILAGVEKVYHCAAIVSFYTADRKKMIANNVDGTANLVNASIHNGVKKFCHVSSIAALGRTLNGIPVTEETSWIPSKKNSGYSESKFFSEAEVWRGIQEGLDSVIVNPSIILGPGEWDTGSPKLFKSIYDGMKFYTKGITGYVDIEDVVKAMVLLMSDKNFESCKNQRFLLNSENRSYHDIFYSIADELRKKRPQYYVSDFMLGFVWRLAAFGSFITRKPSVITRDAVTNSNRKFYFDGNKINQKIEDFRYKNISDSVKDICAILLSEKQ